MVVLEVALAIVGKLRPRERGPAWGGTALQR